MAPSRLRPADRPSGRAAGRTAPQSLVPRLAAPPTLANLAIAAVAAVGAACGTARPAPTTPARPTPTRPAASAPTPPVASTRFSYATTPTSYEVATDGTVATEGDSAAPVHVATTTRVTLTVGAGDDDRAVRGTVDAFATPGSHATPTTLHLPLALVGSLDTRHHRATLTLAAPQPADTACLATPPAAKPGTPPARPTPATPALSLLATARELLVAPPAQLDAGTHWDDEMETVECRGAVAVTTRTKYRYEVRGPATFAGVATAIRVARTSESESRGEHDAGGRSVHISAASRGAFDLYLDPLSGRYLGGTGQSEGTLEVDTGDGHPRRFTQRFTTRVGARGRSR